MATPPESNRALTARDQLLALTDELLEQASALREHWNDLHHALHDEADDGQPERPLRRGPRSDEPSADPRRLIAVDLILAGRSREQVYAYLQEEYGDDAAAEVTADIYGSEPEG
jgi:hypothetical protein